LIIFENMYAYEVRSSSFFGVFKNLLFCIVLVIKQLILKKQQIYYYKKGGLNLFLTEFYYLYKAGDISRVSKQEFDVLSMVDLNIKVDEKIILKFKYKPFKLYNYIATARKEKKIKIIHMISMLRSCMKYSFIFDYEFQKFRDNATYNYNNFIINDPANPFTKYLSLNRSKSPLYLCSTMISHHSTEWRDIEEKYIFVVQNSLIQNQFKEVLGKNINYISNKFSPKRNKKFHYKTLFIHQYFHKLAFESRIIHLWKSLAIAQRKGVLTRLHPNASILDKIVFKIFGIFGMLNISVEDFEHDCNCCRYAVSFSSTALLEFKGFTGRRARYLKSKHMKWQTN